MHPADGHKVLLASSNPELLQAASVRAGVGCIELLDEPDLAKQLIESLRSLGLHRILLEGGPQIIRSFAIAGLIDGVHLTVTGSESEISVEDARAFVSEISYLPEPGSSLQVNFDGTNNYLVWQSSGVAARN